MNPRLRIGIVGCGRMGREHAGHAVRLGADLAFLCDADPRAVDALGEEHPEARRLTDPSEIAWGAIDAVFVCTPPFARGPVELAAVEAGVPLFVEKPVGLSAETCGPLLRALEHRPVVHAVGYMNRYRRSVEAARARLDRRRVIGFQGRWLAAAYRPPWWLRADGSGGPINEQCTHLVDVCRLLLGDVRQVSAFATPFPGRPELEGSAAIALTLAGGACGTILYSCRAPEKDIGLHVATETGPVALRGWDFRGDGESDDGAAADAGEAFRLEVSAFLDAVRHGSQRGIRCDLREALRTQATVDAIRRSIGSGRPENVAGVAGLAAEIGGDGLAEVTATEGAGDTRMRA